MRRPPLSEKYDMDFLNEELPRRENSFAVDAVMLWDILIDLDGEAAEGELETRETIWVCFDRGGAIENICSALPCSNFSLQTRRWLNSCSQSKSVVNLGSSVPIHLNNSTRCIKSLYVKYIIFVSTILLFEGKNKLFYLYLYSPPSCLVVWHSCRIFVKWNIHLAYK